MQFYTVPTIKNRRVNKIILIISIFKRCKIILPFKYLLKMVAQTNFEICLLLSSEVFEFWYHIDPYRHLKNININSCIILIITLYLRIWTFTLNINLEIVFYSFSNAKNKIKPQYWLSLNNLRYLKLLSWKNFSIIQDYASV